MSEEQKPKRKYRTIDPSLYAARAKEIKPKYPPREFPQYNSYFLRKIENGEINPKNGRPIGSKPKRWKQNSVTSPSNIIKKMNALEWLELRVQGYSYAQMEKITGYPAKKIQEQLKKFMEKNVSQLIEIQRKKMEEKYESLLQVLEKKVYEEGDLASMREYIKILNELRKLLGIDNSVPKVSTNFNISSRDVGKLSFGNLPEKPNVIDLTRKIEQQDQS